MFSIAISETKWYDNYVIFFVNNLYFMFLYERIIMKRRTLICILLALLMIFGVSCSKGDTADTEKTDNVPVEISAEYKIVHESKAYKEASLVRTALKKLLGKTPDMTSDGTEPAQAYEILIGDTGRAESNAFLAELPDYSYGVKIEAKEGSVKIILAGKKTDYLLDAAKLLINEYLPSESTTLVLKTTETKITENSDDKNKDILMKAQPIQWTENSQFVTNGGYARLLDLPDGRLAMAYSAGNAIKFAISSDDGQSWAESYKVAEIDQTPLGQKMSNANANAVVMENGDIMVAFRAHTATSIEYTQFYSSIRFSISKDGGKTWSKDKIVVENTYNGNKFTGFWEPHMIYIKDGKLAMYYANDCIGGDASGYPFVSSQTYQHIMVHTYDEQTENFGAPIIASNGIKHNSRDGMPVVCKLSDGSYAMVIESSVMRGKYAFIIQILFSEDGIVWSEPKNVFCPSTIDNYAGAPFITCLDDGRIVISCQATEGSGTTIANDNVHNSTMNVLISEKPITYADRDTITQKNFKKIFFNPFSFDTKNSYAIWPAMSLHNGKLYCIAQCGYNTSASTVTGTGLHIRIGTVK